MKTLSLRLVLGAILAYATWAATAMAATEAEKLTAIQNGLAHLASIQQPGGYWNYGGYEQAATGAAAFAFLSQQDKWDTNTAQYQTVVDNAITYLLNNASTMGVSTRNDGVNICPGGSGSCTGVYWFGNGESTYTTGLVAPAIAAYGQSKGANVVATSSGPLAGMTWGQIAQGITNEFAASQSTSINGNRDGGWRYYIPGNGDSDSSTTQWAVISLIYDQTLGATTPQVVINDLKVWLAAVQVSGQGGAACYQPDYLLCEQSDTGGLLIGLKFVGDDLSNSQVQAALGFLNNNWPPFENNIWYGNFGHPYAMWSVYKGLEVTIGLSDTTIITNLLTTCGAPNNLPGNPPGSVLCNWWEDYNEWLVRNQNFDGSWSGYYYWVDPLSTAFDVSILGATQIPAITASCVAINAVQGVAITPVTMTASGGAGGPYTFSATGLPNGLTMSSSGTISGTPTVSGTFNYTVTITDSAGNTGTVNCSVTVSPSVSGPVKTGALTMGFWQNKNGQAIITGGASTSGVCNSGTWLRQYAPYQDLSAMAKCSQVATYVTNIIKAASASGASMNAMLKAQMLATSLDVYFSDPALGGNKIAAPVLIGSVSIDLTKVCKMIDSSSGTATCSGVYQSASSAFGGATSLTVSQMLAYAASQSNAGGGVWYGQVKATQQLAKNAFDAINNQVAFAP